MRDPTNVEEWPEAVVVGENKPTGIKVAVEVVRCPDHDPSLFPPETYLHGGSDGLKRLWARCPECERVLTVRRRDDA